MRIEFAGKVQDMRLKTVRTNELKKNDLIILGDSLSRVVSKTERQGVVTVSVKDSQGNAAIKTWRNVKHVNVYRRNY